MGRKFSNLDNDERKTIEEELDSKSQEMGMTSFESYGTQENNAMKDLVGLCADCKMFNYCKTEFGTVLAKCEEFNIRLSGQNRITECNLHSPKRALTLNEMYSIAYLIDPAEPSVKGFISKDAKLMGKPKNKGFIS